MYHANMTAGGLLLRESRIMAALLLDGISQENLVTTVVAQNLLQKTQVGTSRKIARLVANRLALLTEPALQMIAVGDKDTATQILFAAIITQNRILGDFLLYTHREIISIYKNILSLYDWDIYFEQCILLQENLQNWKMTTRKKIRSSTFTLLIEAKILENAQSKKIQTLLLSPEVVAYLEKHHFTYALLCLKGVS